jgi:hypothetical protein
MQDERDDRQPMATMAARLAKVHGQMTDEQFAQLLADIGRTADRFVEIDDAPGSTLPAEPTDPDRR